MNKRNFNFVLTKKKILAFELPQLPYSYDALTPHIDAKTMEIHHGKHHGGYTTKLNVALEGSEMEDDSIENILKKMDMNNGPLRNNGGGYLHEADSLTRLFINYGPTVQIKSPNEDVIIYDSWKSNRSWSKPLVVLVNKFSASASEIFAGAMQDYNRAIIVGQTTFGKGSVQKFTETDNGQIKLTDSLYYRVTGEPTQIFGVKPSLEIPSLIDGDGLGEDRYENAIKPSRIENSWYYSNEAFNMDVYLTNHEKRIAESKYFSEMDTIKNYRDNNKKRLSLQITERESNYEDNKQRNLKLINLGREISGKDLFETYEEYLDREIDDSFVLDAEIDQSLKILMDLIEVKSW